MISRWAQPLQTKILDLKKNKNIVRMLRENGTEVNIHGRKCTNVLQGKSLDGHENIARLLLDTGA